jgi:hypothetical protein
MVDHLNTHRWQSPVRFVADESDLRLGPGGQGESDILQPQPFRASASVKKNC